MTSSTPQERYHLVAPLPPLCGWRRMLALDRRVSQSAPVVLSFAPLELVEDAARLAALSRDAEAGARVHHPHVVQVLGLEAVDDQLALVEPYRAGTPLRALLDASGRLPVELAVRVACDVAAGLGALHGLGVGDGQPLAHGALTAERVLVAEDGAALVTGVGTGGGRSTAEDVRALAAVLAEALTGEPAHAGAKLELGGVPEALAGVIDGAREDAFPGAAAFAEALAAAFAPAPAAAVAVYVGAVTPPQAAIPPEAPPPSSPVKPPPVSEVPAPAAALVPAASLVARVDPAPSLEAPEVSAELIAPGRLATPPPASEPLAERTPPPDAAITFPAPAAAVPRRLLPRALVLAAVGLVGLGVGLLLSRLAFGARMPVRPATADAPPPVVAEPAVAVPGPSPATEAKAPRTEPSPATAPRAARAEPQAPAKEAEAPAAAAKAPPPRKPPSISVTATPPGEIFVDGKRVGRPPLVVEVSAGEHDVRLRDRAQGVDAKQRVRVKAAATPVRFQLIRGKLDVTAPADTEVWVDGRRVGLGDQSVELWEGSHEVEARRGTSRVKQRFELGPLVTRWTYNVTPTP